MWPIISTLAIVLAQAAHPGINSKLQKWCFDRGQGGVLLCEATEAECNNLRSMNDEIARSPCRRVELPEIQSTPTKPPAPSNPEKGKPRQQ